MDEEQGLPDTGAYKEEIWAKRKKMSMSAMKTQTSSMLKKRGGGVFREAMVEEMSDFDSEEDLNDKDGFNSHCGLRTISEKVLQVLLEKRTTTYK